MSNGTPYTSYLSYCKVGGSFQIKHDVPQATSPDPSVHGTVALTCSNPPVDGKCGSSNGGTFSSQPTTNLCTSGTTSWSDSSGSDGSYNWSCAGSNGEQRQVARQIEILEMVLVSLPPQILVVENIVSIILLIGGVLSSG